MIKSTDRSGYFGASDCKFVMAKNRNTKSWKQWWSVKLGDMEPVQLGGQFIEAGNKYEHPILESIADDMVMDGQIIYEKYLIRVNYDGYRDGIIYEIKTHSNDKEFDLNKSYWMQCQVEMFVYQTMYEKWFLPPFKQLYLVSYGLNPDEYGVNYDKVEIDANRLRYHPVEYDKSWIKTEYLPAVKELSRALKKGKVNF